LSSEELREHLPEALIVWLATITRILDITDVLCKFDWKAGTELADTDRLLLFQNELIFGVTFRF
jgi:hypothetical protein